MTAHIVLTVIVALRIVLMLVHPRGVSDERGSCPLAERAEGRVRYADPRFPPLRELSASPEKRAILKPNR